MSEACRRLFLAVWPSEGLRHRIERSAHVAMSMAQGRAVPARNFHITLVFLGTIAESRLHEVRQCADETAVEPFSLRFGNITSWKRQKLLCLEPIEGQDKVAELVDRLRASLKRRDFRVEERAYRAHVTLAREIRQTLPEPMPIETLCWPVDRVELVESKISGKASAYTVI